MRGGNPPFSLSFLYVILTENRKGWGVMADQEKWELSREEIEARLREQNQKHKKKGNGRSQNQRLKLFSL